MIKKDKIKSLELFHASNIRNHDKIMSDGLKCGLKPSGYGDIPVHKAIYLYYKKNVDVPCDLLEIFGAIDIYKVTITDFKHLIPDEDSKKMTWLESLELMGTVGYTKDILPEEITYVGRVTSEDQILK